MYSKSANKPFFFLKCIEKWLYLYMKARDLYKDLGYKKWDKFLLNIQKAKNTIKNGEHTGKILELKRIVQIGSGAQRAIIDFEIDENALELIKKLSITKKLVTIGKITNETSILNLLKKYCEYKKISFYFQKRIGSFYYDALIGNERLIEFDEPHHRYIKEKDISKEIYANQCGYEVIRFNCNDDIIDIINKLGI